MLYVVCCMLYVVCCVLCADLHIHDIHPSICPPICAYTRLCCDSAFSCVYVNYWLTLSSLLSLLLFLLLLLQAPAPLWTRCWPLSPPTCRWCSTSAPTPDPPLPTACSDSCRRCMSRTAVAHERRTGGTGAEQTEETEKEWRES